MWVLVLSYVWTVSVYYVCKLFDRELSIICWKVKMLPFKSTFIKVLSSNPFDTKPGNKITVLSSNPIGTSPRNKILLLNSFQANVLFPYGLKHSKNRVFFMFFRLTKPWNYSHINFPFTYRNIHKTRNASLENISLEKIKLKNLLQVYFEKLLFLMKLFVLSEMNLKTVEGTWSSYYYGYKTRNTSVSISFISKSYFFIIYNTTILQN